MRLAVRSLLKAPGFSAAVVLTLAIGLGANAALFAVVNRILLRPPPYADPARLVAVGETRDGLRDRPGPVSAPTFLAWQRETRTIERLAAYRPWGFVLTGSGEPERLTGARVSADLFSLLGITPTLGRTFTPDEDVFGKPRVAVVSEALWQRRLGSDRDLARRPLVLNGVAHAVIGVLPRGFSLPEADVLAIRDSLRWAAAGLAGGGVLAFFAARALAGALYEVPPTDLVTFAGAGAAATMVVLLGSTLAARTAMNVDPLVASRDQ
jgi:hypothetical protein